MNTSLLKFLGLSCSLAVTCSSHAAQTFATDSIQVFNNAPIVNLFAFARPDYRVAKPLASSTFRAQYEVTNYISSGSKNADVFFIDGETLSLRHSYSYQLNARWQLGFSIPWLRHSGGFTDAFIYDFHDALQLPQNGRKENNADDIRWRLMHNNQTLVAVDDNLSAWGDLSITAQLTPEDQPSARWTFMTKLPTGDYAKQTGSEKVDIGVSYAAQNPEWFQSRSLLADLDLAFWYGAGINLLGEPKALRALNQHPVVATFRTGLGYAPFKHWNLKTQIDSQSPLFNTEIRELGWFPLLISFATSHQIGSAAVFEFVIIEDLRPRSGPDVIFQTNYQITF